LRDDTLKELVAADLGLLAGQLEATEVRGKCEKRGREKVSLAQDQEQEEGDGLVALDVLPDVLGAARATQHLCRGKELAGKEEEEEGTEVGKRMYSMSGNRRHLVREEVELVEPGTMTPAPVRLAAVGVFRLLLLALGSAVVDALLALRLLL
jgi:elongation factor P--beta-lysine ligase